MFTRDLVTGYTAGLVTTVATNLASDLGVTLQAKQDSNLIKAIADPSNFIRYRQNTILNMFDDKDRDCGEKNNDNTVKLTKGEGLVTAMYTAKLKEYKEIGIPERQAQMLATKAANSLYEQNLEILELTMPGAYQKAYGTSLIKHEATVAASNLSEMEMQQKWKQEYKAKKKAKKAKKASKLASK